MIFGALNFINLVKYYLPEIHKQSNWQRYFLTFFIFLSKFEIMLVFTCFHPSHCLTNGRVSLLHFYHFRWRHSAQDFNHTGVQFQFLLGRFVFLILYGHLTFLGNLFPSIIPSSYSHSTAYQMVSYCSDSESLSISSGT